MLLTQSCLRWDNRRSRFKPAHEVIKTADYEVAEIRDDGTAKRFVESHHYSGSYPAARFRFGLYHRQGGLVGVAVLSHPANEAVLTRTFPGESLESTELGRFVLLDNVPGNGESWFLAESMRQLRQKGILGIISFSDPIPRTALDGTSTFPGHIGTIYQATNATYLGRGTPRTLKLLPDATVFSDRTISKIRAQERGATYSENILVRHGAEPRENQDPREWLAYWLPQITRPLRHPGNHRYAWILPKGQWHHLPVSLPYPTKQLALAA